MSAATYAFGPFELDAPGRRLRRDGEPLAVPDRQIEILLHLVARAGSVVSKDALIEAAWRDVAVTDNSLEQAISALRRTLGGRGPAGTSPSDGMGQAGTTAPYIETVPRRGYRFRAEVSRHVARQSDASLDELLLPHRAWLEGRAALETLGRLQASHARQTFAAVLAAAPDYAPAHIGLANAYAFEFEATRADNGPDRAALTAAVTHAREACRLEPQSAEPWATLGFVLHLTRESELAIAAARRAIALEPDNWRHQLRLAVVSWGEERLRAAQRTLALLPGLALAHWLAATVHVARQALDRAEAELELGTQAQDAQTPKARFGAVALHWLLGLVCLARGDEARALVEFERELAFEGADQLYARECCANTWYAIGAIRLRNGNTGAAAEAFAEALRRVPMHPLAMTGAAAASGTPASTSVGAAGRPAGASLAVDAAMARAAALVLRNDSAAAAQLLEVALDQAPPGSSGWTLPVEPLLQASSHPDAWRSALTRLRSRAA